MNNDKSVNEAEKIEARREYHREWRKNHPESVKAARDRFWIKKAAEMKQAAEIRNEEETEAN